MFFLHKDLNLHSKKRPDTAVTQFKNSLNELIKILSSKEPSYIRCIKPNDFKLPSKCSLLLCSYFIVIFSILRFTIDIRYLLLGKYMTQPGRD